MTQPSESRRASCALCLRPQRTCICHWITPTDHAVEVVILQHPLEVHNAKGTARLLHLSLPGSRLVTGEAFTGQELQTLLYGPSDSSNARGAGVCPLLLYPELQHNRAAAKPGPQHSDPVLTQDPPQYRLLVLDGTWRKTRKMLYLNRPLQELPRLPLSAVRASRYAIRKAHRPDQLSTLEATCYALMRLEGNEAKYEPLLAAFEGFVAQQALFDAKRLGLSKD